MLRVIARAIGRALFGVVPKPRSGKLRRRQDRLKTAATADNLSEAADSEAPPPARRRQAHDAVHGARALISQQRSSGFQDFEDEEEEGSDAADDDHDQDCDTHGFHDKDLNEMITALEQRAQIKGQAETDEEENRKRKAVKAIVKCRSTTKMFHYLDTLIESDWLGTIDELPGNIYSIMAFKPLPDWSYKFVIRRFGFFFIFFLQLLGPPLIFYQMFTISSIPDPDRLRWDEFPRFYRFEMDLSDWYNDYWTTKAVALMFLITFCMNGLYVQIIERESWTIIDKLYRELDQDYGMDDTTELFLMLGAFMNTWVICWLCVDMFLVMGCSDTVQDVCMDALGLSFLYNLDDVGGDLGFVDTDDWPGLELKWLAENIQQYAEKIDDVEEKEPEVFWNGFLYFGSVLLSILSFTLPVLFVITPFQKLKPDPFYESIDEAFLKDYVQKAVQQVLKNASAGVRVVHEL